jgi:hypothetical protein
MDTRKSTFPYFMHQACTNAGKHCYRASACLFKLGISKAREQAVQEGKNYIISYLKSFNKKFMADIPGKIREFNSFLTNKLCPSRQCMNYGSKHC